MKTEPAILSNYVKDILTRRSSYERQVLSLMGRKSKDDLLISFLRQGGRFALAPKKEKP